MCCAECCRGAMMLPPSIQVCPVEILGRGRRSGEPTIADVQQLAESLALALPMEVSDKAGKLHSHLQSARMHSMEPVQRWSCCSASARGCNTYPS